MDIALDPELAAFRDEVAAFLADAVTPELLEEMDAQEAAESNWSPTFSRELAARGWLNLTWPREYGGGAKPLTYLAVLNEQLGRVQAPIGWHNIATEWVAMPLIRFGTDAQKSRFLPPIARAELCFGPAFTEPEAGSDLASIKTRAVRDGDDYVLNGLKVFSTEAHRANYLWLLAVTDPDAQRHRNLSVFIVDTTTPGVTIKGVRTINHGRVNDVYLEEVRVPADNRVGPENEGWRVAMSTLNIERSGMYYVAASQALLRDLVEFCRHAERRGRPLLADQSVRRGLAAWAVEFEAQRALSQRVVWMQSQGHEPSVEPSVQSMRMRMAQHPFANFALDVLGLAGQLSPGDAGAPLRGRIERLYLASCSQHSGGTTEIQKNLIALRGLGLPRS
jgi:alkylation response protein AidB-like acyl-CoA dehydrogenase